MKQQQPHFDHVQEHLERVRDGYSYIPYPESIYFGHQEGDHFWELIGLRLQGCPVIVLAALRFERIERKGVADSRQSLASYLTENPDPDRPEGGRLIAFLPNKDQAIPQFLTGLRAGKELTPVSIDRARVEVAFDFRADNPAASRDLVEAAPPLTTHYYRTVEGHVLRGESHEVEPADAPGPSVYRDQIASAATAAGCDPYADAHRGPPLHRVAGRGGGRGRAPVRPELGSVRVGDCC